MIFDPDIHADLAVAITPKSYVRIAPMTQMATPLGAGFGVTRFASPAKAFQVIYIAQDLTTGVAESLVRTGFRAKRGAHFSMSKPRFGARLKSTPALYFSRLTGRTCIFIYDRALPGGLVATVVVEVTLPGGFVDALRELNVTLIASP